MNDSSPKQPNAKSSMRPPVRSKKDSARLLNWLPDFAIAGKSSAELEAIAENFPGLHEQLAARKRVERVKLPAIDSLFSKNTATPIRTAEGHDFGSAVLDKRPVDGKWAQNQRGGEQLVTASGHEISLAMALSPQELLKQILMTLEDDSLPPLARHTARMAFVALERFFMLGGRRAWKPLVWSALVAGALFERMKNLEHSDEILRSKKVSVGQRLSAKRSTRKGKYNWDEICAAAMKHRDLTDLAELTMHVARDIEPLKIAENWSDWTARTDKLQGAIRRCLSGHLKRQNLKHAAFEK